MGLVAKSRCQQGCNPSRDSGEGPVLAFSSFWRLPAFLGLWPLYILKAVNGLSSPCHTSSFGHWPSFPSCGSTVPLWIIQDNLPDFDFFKVSRLATLIPSTTVILPSSPLPCVLVFLREMCMYVYMQGRYIYQKRFKKLVRMIMETG